MGEPARILFLQPQFVQMFQNQEEPEQVNQVLMSFKHHETVIIPLFEEKRLNLVEISIPEKKVDLYKRVKTDSPCSQISHLVLDILNCSN
jgi:hypothetical protein